MRSPYFKFRPNARHCLLAFCLHGAGATGVQARRPSGLDSALGGQGLHAGLHAANRGRLVEQGGMTGAAGRRSYMPPNVPAESRFEREFPSLGGPGSGPAPAGMGRGRGSGLPGGGGGGVGRGGVGRGGGLPGSAAAAAAAPVVEAYPALIASAGAPATGPTSAPGARSENAAEEPAPTFAEQRAAGTALGHQVRPSKAKPKAIISTRNPHLGHAMHPKENAWGSGNGAQGQAGGQKSAAQGSMGGAGAVG